jgi:hypothetical protein
MEEVVEESIWTRVLDSTVKAELNAAVRLVKNECFWSMNERSSTFLRNGPVTFPSIQQPAGGKWLYVPKSAKLRVGSLNFNSVGMYSACTMPKLDDPLPDRPQGM